MSSAAAIVAIVLLVTGLTLLGESLNETINPVLRKRRYENVSLAPPGVAEAEME